MENSKKLLTFAHAFGNKACVDPLAQSVEHNTFNVGVMGSSPMRITENVKEDFGDEVLFHVYTWPLVSQMAHSEESMALQDASHSMTPASCHSATMAFTSAWGFHVRHFVFLTKPFRQRLNGEVTHRHCLFPQPCRRLIHSQQLSEIDGAEALAHHHVLTAHFAQHKSLPDSHNRLYIANKYLLMGRSQNHVLAADFRHLLYK